MKHTPRSRDLANANAAPQKVSQGQAGAHPLDFRVTNVAQRLAQTGDRWRDALNNKQSLEHALSS